MGADFLQRVGQTLKRSWDHGRASISEVDLTTRQIVSGGRGVAAEIVKGTALAQGEPLTAELEGSSVVFRRRLAVVARTDTPSEVVVSVLREFCNVRPATVSEVHDMAGIVEIAIKC